MNILPKKRWHVRTKENIARVRRDEAEAAEQAKKEQLRIDNAEREARLSVLKTKSKAKLLESGVTDVTSENSDQIVCNQHINLFEDIEHTVKITNKDHDKEVKQKQEEYEKKIGYLTYLGQDTNEALKKKNWYEVAPDSSKVTRPSEVRDTYDKLVLKDPDGKPKTRELDIKDGEVAWKIKQKLDPVNAFKEYLHKGRKELQTKTKPSSSSKEYVSPTTDDKKKKHKKEKKCKKDKKYKEEKEMEKRKKIQKLREARLRREQQEKQRTAAFLSGLSGEPPAEPKEPVPPKIKPKYNSQFNPELARQNYQF